MKPVKDDVESLLSNLGGSSSSRCDGTRKRGFLGAIGNIVNRLSCLGKHLEDITRNIGAGDVNGIDQPLQHLTSENKELTDDEDDKSTKSDIDPSTSIQRTSSLASSLFSCTYSTTALQVTVQCRPTVLTSSGSTISTTTCSPLNTVTASGCSVTATTTILSAPASASQTQIQCARGSCGNACTKNGGALSGASMGVLASTNDCASIPTVTTSVLPVANVGIFGTTTIMSPIPESPPAAMSKRNFFSTPIERGKTPVDHSLVERALSSIAPHNYTGYVQSYNPYGSTKVEKHPHSGLTFEMISTGPQVLTACTGAYL